MDTLFLFALVVKHAFCDLYLQFKKVPLDKTRYLGECHLHYFDHAILTLMVSYFFLIPLEYCFILSSIDYILHWHIDYIKTKIMRLLKITNSSMVYWLFQTFDQILHYCTYLLLVYIVSQNFLFQDMFKKFVSLFY